MKIIKLSIAEEDLTPQQRDWRAGRCSPQRNKVLRCKAVLKWLQQNSPATSEQIIAAGFRPGDLFLAIEHNLVQVRRPNGLQTYIAL